jgi:cell division protein ZapA
MSAKIQATTITIMDRSYSVKCPPEQLDQLYQAAEHLDAWMRRAMQSAPAKTPTDSLAVLAALNICSEMMALKKQRDNYIDSLNQRVADLEARMGQALVQNQEETV